MGLWFVFLKNLNVFSGKSLLLPKIRESMSSFSRSWQDGIELYWSWTFLVVLFFFCFLITLFIVTIIQFFDSLKILYPLIFGISIYVIFVSIYGFIYYGSEFKLWNGSIIVARFLAGQFAKYFFCCYF